MRYFSEKVNVTDPNPPPQKLAFENRFITVTFENYREKRDAGSPMFEQLIGEQDTAGTIASKLMKQDNPVASLFPSGLPVEAILILADYVLAPGKMRLIHISDITCLQAAEAIRLQSRKLNGRYTGKSLASKLRSASEDEPHRQMREGDAKAVEITFNAILSKLSSPPTL